MKTNNIFKHLILIISMIILTGCSSIDSKTGERRDPLEKFNRAMWAVNYNVLDPYLLKPVAKGWKNYVPTPVKTGLINVSSNLTEPASFVNRLLQGDLKKAMVHFNRFWINSSFGLGGLIDFASEMKDLKLKEERHFGHTLGKYGVGDGPYLMLPVFGPKTPREMFSYVDYSYPVLSLLTLPATLTKSVIDNIDKRAKLLDSEDIIHQSQDPYIAVREAYYQYSEFELRDGKVNQDNLQNNNLSEEDLKDID